MQELMQLGTDDFKRIPSLSWHYVVHLVLSLLKPLTLFLQKTDCNMVSDFDEAKKNLIQLLNTKRNDEQLNCLFSRAERLEVDLKPKRRVGRQVRRENAAPDTSPVKHWRINLFPLYRSRNIRNGETLSR